MNILISILIYSLQAFCRGALIRMHLKKGEFLKEGLTVKEMQNGKYDSSEDASQKNGSFSSSSSTVNEKLDRFAAIYLKVGCFSLLLKKKESIWQFCFRTMKNFDIQIEFCVSLY